MVRFKGHYSKDIIGNVTTLTVTRSSPISLTFSINGKTYTRNDFVDDALVIQIPKNTDLPYTVTYDEAYFNVDPSSGTINTSTPYTLRLHVYFM